MNNLSTLNHRDITQMPLSNGVFPIVPFGLMNSVYWEVKYITQASDEMIIMVMLTTISTVIQGLIDVELPIGKKSPVLIYGLIHAESGERKSTVENLFVAGLRKYQKESLVSYREKQVEYEIDRDIYEVKQKALKKLMVNNKLTKEERNEYQFEFSQNRKECPLKPIYPKIMYEDSTIEALLFGLYTNASNGYFGSSEGGVLLNSKSMNDTSKFNALWSADDIAVDRKSSDSFVLSDARVSILIMTQYSAFQEYLKKNKHDTRGSGFWARFLVCAPNTTCGTRKVTGEVQSKDNLKLFETKIIQLLEQQASTTNDSERNVISFSNEAKVIWIDIANDIELHMLPGGRYFNAKDHASKLADNIARVAALLQYFEEPKSKLIETDSLWAAVNICSFFSNEFLKVFNAPPQYVYDAHILQRWLEQNKTNGIRYIRRNNIMQYGPRKVRKKALLDAALDYLCQTQYLSYFPCGRISVIDIFPRYTHDPDKLNKDIFDS